MEHLVMAAVLISVHLGAPVFAEEQPEEADLSSYQFVLLRRGPERTPIGEREIQRLQERHLAHLERLHRDDRLLIEGPLDGAGDLRGVIVLDVGSTDRAEAVMADDAWVASGRLETEVHTWLTFAGVLRRPHDLDHNARCWLGLLYRPDNAPSYSPAELEGIQTGHLAHIRSMTDSGDLVLAGPMADDGVLRGILIFRAVESEQVVELFRQDPAYRAGRLRMELYPWHVPAGALPDAATHRWAEPVEGPAPVTDR